MDLPSLVKSSCFELTLEVSFQGSPARFLAAVITFNICNLRVAGPSSVDVPPTVNDLDLVDRPIHLRLNIVSPGVPTLIQMFLIVARTNIQV